MIKSIVIALILASSALAQEKVSVKLKVAEIEAVSQAILALDRGSPEVIRVPGKPDSVVYIPYEFPGTVRVAMARNLDILAKELEVFDKVKKASLKSIWGDRTPDEVKDVEETKKWRAQMEPVLEKPVDLQLYTVNYEDLNKIQVSILTLRTLAPILVDKEAPKEAPAVAEKVK